MYLDLNTYFLSVFFFAKKVFVLGDLDAGLQQRQRLLENQIQAADRALKSAADKAVRMGAFQVQTAVNQLQMAKSMQTVAANVLTTNGLNDVNTMDFDCTPFFNNSGREGKINRILKNIDD